MFPLQGAQVQSLVGELRSPMQPGVAKKIQDEKKKITHTHTHTHTHKLRERHVPSKILYNYGKKMRMDTVHALGRKG